MKRKYLLIFTILTTLALSGCNINNSLKNNTDNSIETSTKEDTKEKKDEYVEVSLNAIGDMLVHNTVYMSMQKGNSFDFHPMFEDIAPFINKADFSTANLETVFAGKDLKYSNYPMFNTPEQLGYAMKNTLGIDLVSTNNNHSLDREINGLENTIEFLKGYGLDNIGTYASEKESKKPYIKEVNGAKIGFLSYTYGTNGNTIPPGKEYSVSLTDKEKILTDSKRLEDAGAEFIVALMHWGNEYEHQNSKEQTELATWIFENTNSALIIGNHPHVVQPIEEIKVQKGGKEKTGVVCYALGNFTGNQMRDFSDTGISVNVDLKINKTNPFAENAIKKVTYFPTYIDSNPKSTGKGFRTINALKGISDYENNKDKLITKEEYEKMKKYRNFYTKLIKETDLISAEK